jgi:general secretion pathway protein L
MIESGQNWELFGYDMRNLGRHWVDAWRELLFAYDSPVRGHLDDIVCLRSEAGDTCYQAGKPGDVAQTEYTAFLLPDDIVLSKTLDLPAVVEVDLAAVLALEVNACSPFSADDTSCGWRITHKDSSQIHVLLVILSKSSTMAYLGREFGVHDSRQHEVWAQLDGEVVVVQGFGEEARERNYRKRLLRVAAMSAGSALLALLIVGAATGLKALELQRVQVMAATAQRGAADASRMRLSLGLDNERIAEVNSIAAKYPNPHLEIGRLTHLLEDDESIEQFAMNGLEMDLRGRAADAASVMQRLTDQPDYVEVSAPRAFVRMKGTQIEQFYLNIRLRERGLP